MKLSRVLLSAVAVATAAACGNLSQVTDSGLPIYENVDGVPTPKLVWPKVEDATFNDVDTLYGSWPNWDSVRMIERGMDKPQLYNLIGRPHFWEGLYGVDEWNYVFNYRENGEHKICQYKILFDREGKAQSFFWYPNKCNGSSSFNLSGDFLFDFDKDTLTQQGAVVVDNVAAQLKSLKAKEVKVAGYTDRLGSDSYNLALSQRRADRVKARLMENGVVAHITAIGYGKKDQLKACEGFRHGSAQEIECLKPNRRVEITSSGSEVRSQEGALRYGGTQGPSVFYKKY